MKTKAIYALLAAAIAFGLWLYVITVVNPEAEQTYYDVPVVLSNESVLKDKGLMIATDTQPKVTLVLKGNRTDLNKLKNSDITLLADLSRINAAGDQNISYSIGFPGGFADNAFEVLSHAPDKVELSIVEWGAKEVDVTVNYVGSVALEYIVDKNGVQLDHEKVTITGPKSVIDQITQARIDVDLSSRDQTFSESFRYTLCDDEGEPVDAAQIKTNVAEVNMTLRIQRVKEIPLNLKVNYGGGATEQTSIVQIDPLTIKVAGSETLLEGLNSLELGTVNLADITEDTVLTFPITLTEGLTNLSGQTEATVTIAFPELEVKTLSVDKIQVVNAPAGVKVNVGTQVCSVTVRGPKAQIDAITEEHLTVRVDLSNVEAGENMYAAHVYVDGAFPGVGVLGSYNILVRASNVG